MMRKIFSKASRVPSSIAATMPEQDWDNDVPRVKLFTAFMVMLFLHVAVVGGVILFHYLQKDPGTPVVATAESIPPAAAVAGGAAATAPTAGIRLDDPALANLRRHVVRTHETMDMVAGQYGVTREALAGLNRIEANNPFRIGMTLVIPETPVARPFEAVAAGNEGAAPAVQPAREVPEPLAEEPAHSAPAKEIASGNRAAAPVGAKTSRHTVRSGDTLWSIAKRYGVTLPALMKANAITDANHLKEGASLVIP